mmetsp:Transcript_129301/g.335267  ORF Transcript_129301/g.335267 Transcript_129301/m.335267 type:complete len:335 (-) Transcript_129301:1005-2009(-)
MPLPVLPPWLVPLPSRPQSHPCQLIRPLRLALLGLPVQLQEAVWQSVPWMQAVPPHSSSVPRPLLSGGHPLKEHRLAWRQEQHRRWRVGEGWPQRASAPASPLSRGQRGGQWSEASALPEVVPERSTRSPRRQTPCRSCSAPRPSAEQATGSRGARGAPAGGGGAPSSQPCTSRQQRGVEHHAGGPRGAPVWKRCGKWPAIPAPSDPSPRASCQGPQVAGKPWPARPSARPRLRTVGRRAPCPSALRNPLVQPAQPAQAAAQAWRCGRGGIGIPVPPRCRRCRRCPCQRLLQLEGATLLLSLPVAPTVVRRLRPLVPPSCPARCHWPSLHHARG